MKPSVKRGNVRVGLAGAGRIGEVHFASLLRDPRCGTVKVHDLDVSRATELTVTAPDARASVARSTVELFDDIDALVIASPTPTHLPLLREAISRGVPTFCEKPVAMASADVERVAAEAAAGGVAVQVGFHYRFDPALQELAAEGWAGGRKMLRILSTTAFAPTAEYLAGAGGLIADKLIHELDLVRWMTGSQPRSVCALTADEEAMTAALVVTFEDGGIATIWGGYESVAGFDLTVEKEDASGARVIGNRRPLSNKPLEVPVSTVTDFRERFMDAYAIEIAAFLDVVAGERENPCSLDEAVATQRLVDACAESLITAQVVPVPNR
ncbi:Gfo/Idh/MocA family oxidoreductase [Nocardioides sp. LHD-245]|uniref:Gfo/Idh/MocA family oxidoreductase n=1 Tax=Nocardioides sp. LHD-245 TaxID=3051387 RepID=UPI0027DEADDC|nr:Gfo/Idh/MocA family oxidoreductase [Nocardioides sp. LHD-245]